MLMDLRLTHERWGSNSNPTLNGHLHYPADIDSPLNEARWESTSKFYVSNPAYCGVPVLSYGDSPPNH